MSSSTSSDPVATTTVQADGTWSTTVPLAHGTNTFTAHDADSDSATAVSFTRVDVSDATLAAVLAAAGPNYHVDDATGAHDITLPVGAANLLVVNAAPDAAALDALTPDGAGALPASNDNRTVVSNQTGAPVTVLSETSSFLAIVAGPVTAFGGDAPTFVADASHDAEAVTLMAGSGRSFLLGSRGTATLVGSTAATGSATLLAESASTTLQGGFGADHLIGIAGDTLIGGSGAGQVFLGFNAGSSVGETLTAGAGGNQVLAVDAGTNFLDASHGGSGDVLWSGSGADAMTGNALGTAFVMGHLVDGTAQGTAFATGGIGNDVFAVNRGGPASYDRIIGGGGSDTAFFNGYAAADATLTDDAATGITHLAFSTGQAADVSGRVLIAIGGHGFMSL